jgi:hypothetical protein
MSNKSTHRMSGDNINLKFRQPGSPLLGGLRRSARAYASTLRRMLATQDVYPMVVLFHDTLFKQSGEGTRSHAPPLTTPAERGHEDLDGCAEQIHWRPR